MIPFWDSSLLYLIQVCLIRVDLAIYIASSDSSGDQLIVLSAKINDNHQCFFHGCLLQYIFSVLYYRVWGRGSQTLLHQFFPIFQGITHFFPFREQFIQNLPLVFEVLCNSTTAPGWILPVSLKASSWLGCASTFQSIRCAQKKWNILDPFAICRFVSLYFPRGGR